MRAASGPPLYYLGDAFEGLPLTHAEERGLLIYGECEPEGEGDTYHCTGPQVQLQHWQLARRHPRMFMLTPSDPAPCARGSIGGRTVAAFSTSGGLEVYLGEQVVVVFAEARRALRAARALRPLRGGPSRAKPPPSVGAALARCERGTELARMIGGG